jgi:hypothetical protein
MRTYKAVIKERGNEHLLTPTYTGENVTRDVLVKHWGLNEPDVEWFKLYDVTNGKEEVV